MARGIGPADIDIDIDIDIGDSGVGGAAPGGAPRPIRPIGVSPATAKQPNEDWFRGNKWPPTDLGHTFQNVNLSKKNTTRRAFPKSPWSPYYYSIAVIGELVLQSVAAPAGVSLLGGAADLRWNNIDLRAPIRDANVANELNELAALIEYRPAVLTEALRQIDAIGVIGYFRGVLNFTPVSHPFTYGLARIGVRVGEFQVMYYKALFNRPRPSTLSPALMPPIEIPGHAAYPSGHATQAHLTALLLAEVMPPAVNLALDSNGQVVTLPGPPPNRPDRRVGPLYRVAERIARNREVLGLHYRSDTVAGRLLAESTFLLLKECAWTQTIITLAKAEWAYPTNA
jgi:membrane-associated phospholipid phosphatase